MKSMIKGAAIALLSILLTLLVIGIAASVMTTTKAQAHNVIPKLRNVDMNDKEILYYCIGGVVYFKKHGAYVGFTPLQVSMHSNTKTLLTCGDFHNYMRNYQGHKHE